MYHQVNYNMYIAKHHHLYTNFDISEFSLIHVCTISNIGQCNSTCYKYDSCVI